MAENAWYEKHKKDVAAAIKKGRGAAKDDGVPCTLVKMKDGSALLCANVSGSKAAALVKEAKGAGGKVLSSGTLYKGDDGPTFGVTDGSISVKVLFSSAAAEAAGSPMNVIVVAVTPAAEAAAASTAAPPAPPPPPPAAAPPAPPRPAAPAPAALDGVKGQFTDLLRQVRPRFQQAVAADPPNKANLEKGMGIAVAAAKENDFGKGLKVLQALDVALQKTPASAAAVPVSPSPAAPTPPPVPAAAVPAAPAAAPPPAPPATAAIQAALTKMLPLVKSTAAANPARKAELLEPLKRCKDHLKADQAAEAKTALFDLYRVVKELTGAAGAAGAASATTAIPPAPAPPVDSDATRFKARLLEVKGEFDQLKRKDPARAEPLGGLLAAAASLARNKEFTDALLGLEELAKALQAASVTAPSADDVKGETEAEEAEAEETAGDKGEAEDKATDKAEAGQEEEKGEEEEEEEEAEEDLVAALDADEDVVERVSLVGLGKARLNWEAAKKQVQAQLDRLEKAIRAEFQDQDGAAAVKNLSHILDNFNEGLSERIDDLLNADGEARRRLAGEARAVNVRYLEFVAKSPLISHVEAHPFDDVKITVRDLLQRPLKALARQLPAALA